MAIEEAVIEPMEALDEDLTRRVEEIMAVGAALTIELETTATVEGAKMVELIATFIVRTRVAGLDNRAGVKTTGAHGADPSGMIFWRGSGPRGSFRRTSYSVSVAAIFLFFR
ncbi:hypothetical protein NE237_002446 [Protea cynaroides]|uniref:Uncharacterized protein n=1 Tax=Protea cynaroides TaxID=273540 RepID=A0A9Q0QZH0_9MAGN|nr:hypothetical protein NE237_002446 [Protea cynaroides]